MLCILVCVTHGLSTQVEAFVWKIYPLAICSFHQSCSCVSSVYFSHGIPSSCGVFGAVDWFWLLKFSGDSSTCTLLHMYCIVCSAEFHGFTHRVICTASSHFISYLMWTNGVQAPRLNRLSFCGYRTWLLFIWNIKIWEVATHLMIQSMTCTIAVPAVISLMVLIWITTGEG